MSETWITILALAVTAAAVRGAGSLLVGDRDLPPRLTGVVDLLGPALLSALVAVQTFGGERSLELDASLIGVAGAAAVLLRNRDALLTAIVVAAALTALLRAA